MKEIDYSKFSLEELEAMDAIASEPTAGDRIAHGAKEYLGRPIGRAARSVAGAFGDFSDLVASPLGLVGLKPRAGEMLREGVDSLTGDYLKPRNKMEEYVDTATDLAAGVPIGTPAIKASKALLSGGQKAARLAQSVLASQNPAISNLSGAAAAGVTGKYMSEENPFDLEDPLAKGAVNLGSSILAGSVPGVSVAAAKGLKNLPAWAATKMATTGEFDPAAVEHARASGIDILPADALKSKQAKRQQQIMASMPFVGGKIQAAMEKRYDQALEALGQSNPANLSKEAGAELVLKGSEANYAHHQKQFNKRYEEIGKKISSYENKAAKKGSSIEFVNPENALSYLDSIRNKLKTKTMKAEFDASPIGERREKLIAMAEEHGGSVPYHDMIEFRKAVDSSVTSFGTHGEIPSAQRKRLSGLINQDVSKYLHSINPELEASWKNVNREYSLYKDKTLPAINKVLKNEKNGTDIGGLIKVLPSKENGGKALKNVLDHLPTAEEKQQLFDIVMRIAGTDNKGNFSMVKAYNYFNNLTPATKNRLLSASGKSPTEIKKYNSVMETVNNMWKTAQEENFSGSGKHLIQHGITTSIAVKVGSGNWLGAAKTVGALALATTGTASGLKNNRLINAMYSGFQKKNMTKGQFDNFCSSVSKADPTFKEIIKNTVKPAALNAAKSHVTKEVIGEPIYDEEPQAYKNDAAASEAPIDYNQYSLEELEAMERQLAEAQ